MACRRPWRPHLPPSQSRPGDSSRCPRSSLGTWPCYRPASGRRTTAPQRAQPGTAALPRGPPPHPQRRPWPAPSPAAGPTTCAPSAWSNTPRPSRPPWPPRSPRPSRWCSPSRRRRRRAACAGRSGRRSAASCRSWARSSPTGASSRSQGSPAPCRRRQRRTRPPSRQWLGSRRRSAGPTTTRGTSLASSPRRRSARSFAESSRRPRAKRRRWPCFACWTCRTHRCGFAWGRTRSSFTSPGGRSCAPTSESRSSRWRAGARLCARSSS
mmetsp:Transcript_9332/g.36443  ORF Transcript_9332/g.36443 Transcript_9332/m.36443 type:complete len:268 (+) Transcript_9332:913-1716(+)